MKKPSKKKRFEIYNRMLKFYQKQNIHCQYGICHYLKFYEKINLWSISDGMTGNETLLRLFPEIVTTKSIDCVYLFNSNLERIIMLEKLLSKN